MNRREFFVNSLAVSGAAATISLLDSEKLIAIPPRTIDVPPTAWNWDGTAEHYLARLNEQFSGHIRQAGRELVSVPELVKSGYRHGSFRAVDQLHTGWQLPRDFRLGMAGLYEECPAAVPMVAHGCVMQINKYDPIASLNWLAEDFAQHVVALNGRGYGELMLPQGLHTAIRQGPFRFLSWWDIQIDHLVVRIDMLPAERLRRI